MSGAEITRDTSIVAGKDHISSDVEGETVILDLRNGVYYGLDAVGTRIWTLIAEPRTVGQVCEAIQAEYDVGREECERDVLRLVGELADIDLIEVAGAGDR